MRNLPLLIIAPFLLFTCYFSILVVKSSSEQQSQVEIMKRLIDKAADQNYCTVGFKKVISFLVVHKLLD